LAPGDAFVLYTDGFPEAMDADNEEFGDERFYAAVASHGPLGARGMIQALLQEVAAHRGEAEQSDDLTIISVRRTS
jgi:serine phosphatase RsbU (regulator of sigma subunit)